MLDVRSMQQNGTKCIDTLCLPFNCGAVTVASIVDRGGVYARILGQHRFEWLGDIVATMKLHSLAWHPHQKRTSCNLEREINLSNTDGWCVGLAGGTADVGGTCGMYAGR